VYGSQRALLLGSSTVASSSAISVVGTVRPAAAIWAISVGLSVGSWASREVRFSVSEREALNEDEDAHQFLVAAALPQGGERFALLDGEMLEVGGGELGKRPVGQVGIRRVDA